MRRVSGFDGFHFGLFGQASILALTAALSCVPPVRPARAACVFGIGDTCGKAAPRATLTTVAVATEEQTNAYNAAKQNLVNLAITGVLDKSLADQAIARLPAPATINAATPSATLASQAVQSFGMLAPSLLSNVSAALSTSGGIVAIKNDKGSLVVTGGSLADRAQALVTFNDNIVAGLVKSGDLSANAQGQLHALVLSGGGNVISNDGASLVGNAGGTLVGNAGGTLVGNAGGTLVGNAGGTLIGNAGGALHLSDAAAKLISNDGGGVVSDNGLGVLPRGASGAISDNGSGIIGEHGAALANNNGKLISNDGGGLISNDGGGAVAKSNVSGAGLASNNGRVISNDGGSLISNDGGGALAKSNASLAGVSLNSLIAVAATGLTGRSTLSVEEMGQAVAGVLQQPQATQVAANAASLVTTDRTALDAAISGKDLNAVAQAQAKLNADATVANNAMATVMNQSDVALLKQRVALATVDTYSGAVAALKASALVANDRAGLDGAIAAKDQSAVYQWQAKLTADASVAAKAANALTNPKDVASLNQDIAKQTAGTSLTDVNDKLNAKAAYIPTGAQTAAAAAAAASATKAASAASDAQKALDVMTAQLGKTPDNPTDLKRVNNQMVQNAIAGDSAAVAKAEADLAALVKSGANANAISSQKDLIGAKYKDLAVTVAQDANDYASKAVDATVKTNAATAAQAKVDTMVQALGGNTRPNDPQTLATLNALMADAQLKKVDAERATAVRDTANLQSQLDAADVMKGAQTDRGKSLARMLPSASDVSVSAVASIVSATQSNASQIQDKQTIVTRDARDMAAITPTVTAAAPLLADASVKSVMQGIVATAQSSAASAQATASTAQAAAAQPGGGFKQDSTITISGSYVDANGTIVKTAPAAAATGAPNLPSSTVPVAGTTANAGATAGGGFKQDSTITISGSYVDANGTIVKTAPAAAGTGAPNLPGSTALVAGPVNAGATAGAGPAGGGLADRPIAVQQAADTAIIIGKINEQVKDQAAATAQTTAVLGKLTSAQVDALAAAAPKLAGVSPDMLAGAIQSGALPVLASSLKLSASDTAQLAAIGDVLKAIPATQLTQFVSAVQSVATLPTQNVKQDIVGLQNGWSAADLIQIGKAQQALAGAAISAGGLNPTDAASLKTVNANMAQVGLAQYQAALSTAQNDLTALMMKPGVSKSDIQAQQDLVAARQKNVVVTSQLINNDYSGKKVDADTASAAAAAAQAKVDAFTAAIGTAAPTDPASKAALTALKSAAQASGQLAKSEADQLAAINAMANAAGTNPNTSDLAAKAAAIKSQGDQIAAVAKQVTAANQAVASIAQTTTIAPTALASSTSAPNLPGAVAASTSAQANAGPTASGAPARTLQSVESAPALPTAPVSAAPVVAAVPVVPVTAATAPQMLASAQGMLQQMTPAQVQALAAAAPALDKMTAAEQQTRLGALVPALAGSSPAQIAAMMQTTKVVASLPQEAITGYLTDIKGGTDLLTAYQRSLVASGISPGTPAAPVGASAASAAANPSGGGAPAVVAAAPAPIVGTANPAGGGVPIAAATSGGSFKQDSQITISGSFVDQTTGKLITTAAPPSTSPARSAPTPVDIPVRTVTSVDQSAFAVLTPAQLADASTKAKAALMALTPDQMTSLVNAVPKLGSISPDLIQAAVSAAKSPDPTLLNAMISTLKVTDQQKTEIGTALKSLSSLSSDQIAQAVGVAKSASQLPADSIRTYLTDIKSGMGLKDAAAAVNAAMTSQAASQTVTDLVAAYAKTNPDGRNPTNPADQKVLNAAMSKAGVAAYDAKLVDAQSTLNMMVANRANASDIKAQRDLVAAQTKNYATANALDASGYSSKYIDFQVAAAAATAAQKQLNDKLASLLAGAAVDTATAASINALKTAASLATAKSDQASAVADVARMTAQGQPQAAIAARQAVVDLSSRQVATLTPTAAPVLPGQGTASAGSSASTSLNPTGGGAPALAGVPVAMATPVMAGPVAPAPIVVVPPPLPATTAAAAPQMLSTSQTMLQNLSATQIQAFASVVPQLDKIGANNVNLLVANANSPQALALAVDKLDLSATEKQQILRMAPALGQVTPDQVASVMQTTKVAASLPPTQIAQYLTEVKGGADPMTALQKSMAPSAAVATSAAIATTAPVLSDPSNVAALTPANPVGGGAPGRTARDAETVSVMPAASMPAAATTPVTAATAATTLTTSQVALQKLTPGQLKSFAKLVPQLEKMNATEVAAILASATSVPRMKAMLDATSLSSSDKQRLLRLAPALSQIKPDQAAAVVQTAKVGASLPPAQIDRYLSAVKSGADPMTALQRASSAGSVSAASSKNTPKAATNVANAPAEAPSKAKSSPTPIVAARAAPITRIEAVKPQATAVARLKTPAPVVSRPIQGTAPKLKPATVPVHSAVAAAKPIVVVKTVAKPAAQPVPVVVKATIPALAPMSPANKR